MILKLAGALKVDISRPPIFIQINISINMIKEVNIK